MMRTGDEFGPRLSRREALALIGGVGAVALAGCGSSGSRAATATPTSAATPAATATTRPSSTPVPSATAAPSETPPPSATQTATATPTGTPTVESLSCIVTPDETEGPYFVDERLNRSDLTTDTDDANVVDGLPLMLQFGVYVVSGNSCTPLAGAQVDVWHADAAGVYSDEQALGSGGETFLRGYQVTDANGRVTFQTIYPGWYPGRTVHVHFKVRTFAAGGATAFEFTSQVFVDDSITDAVFANAPYNARGTRDTRNAADGVYNSPTAGTGGQLLLEMQPTAAGYSGTFTIGLQMS